MWGGADKEQLLPSHRADGRPKDRYPIHFILGTIQVHLVCSHIARYSHESEQAKGQPQGLPVLSASLFFPTVGMHATIRSWSGMRLPAHQSTLQRLGIADMSRDLPMLESSHPWCGNSNTCSLDNIKIRTIEVLWGNAAQSTAGRLHWSVGLQRPWPCDLSWGQCRLSGPNQIFDGWVVKKKKTKRLQVCTI